MTRHDIRRRAQTAAASTKVARQRTVRKWFRKFDSASFRKLKKRLRLEMDRLQ